MRSVAVVGASLAGVSAAHALRAQGFDGRVVVVGDEAHRPYDRPPLSKDFLAGAVDADELALEPEDDDADALAVEWRLGQRACELDPDGRAVVLASGERLVVDGVVVATGARARTLPGSLPAGVHTLRTLDDARALRDELRPGARLVVVGGGFIGAEVAATSRALGVDVTVVEAAPLPLAAALGPTVAAVCAGLHAEHGTALHCSATVAELTTHHDRISGVRLADGRTLPADAVVIGIGSVPNVEWLASAGLASGSGVPTGPDGATANPSVVAAGDCAAIVDPATGRAARCEHWANAQQQPPAAVATLLGRPYRRPASARVPYFWSDQYGHRLQLAGESPALADEVEVVEGDPAAGEFVAVYRRDDRETAVFAMDHARAFTRWRRHLVQSAAPSVDARQPTDPAIQQWSA